MSGYDVTQLGALNTWQDFAGERSTGKHFVDKELSTQYLGMSANGIQPGEQAFGWHTHSQHEEVYVFLTGRGQMGLDDDVIDVQPGTVVRVGQDVWRIWRALPDSPEPLRWLCIRSGGDTLAGIGHDGGRDSERPLPW
ncbi:hypothetical protein GCM10022240_03240 [Microbacterium kribbense]|uniref:Cupin type-2 domain-containing protein n=1 Tax=Microbacterium kribbense TaxID=433645 RepID=A0ABP7G1B5_9MICO